MSRRQGWWIFVLAIFAGFGFASCASAPKRATPSAPTAESRRAAFAELATLFQEGERLVAANPNAAIAKYEAGLAIQERLLAPSDWQIAQTLTAIGGLHLDNGRPRVALPLLQRALAIEEHGSGVRTELLAITLSRLAWCQQSLDQYEAAEQSARRSAAVAEPQFGSSTFMAELLSVLAPILRHRGKLDEAEQVGRRVLALQDAHLPANDPAIAQTANNLALVLADKKDAAGSIAMYRKALEVYEKTGKTRHPRYSKYLRNYGGTLLDFSRIDEAEPVLRQALALQEDLMQPSDPELAMTLARLGEVLLKKNDPTAAEGLFRRALAIREAALGPDHWLTIWALAAVGEALVARGDEPGATVFFRRRLAASERRYGATDPQLSWAAEELAGNLRRQRKHEEAEQLYRRSIAIAESLVPPDNLVLANTVRQLASLLSERGALDEAVQAYQRVLQLREKALGAMNADVVTSVSELADAFTRKGAFAEAEPLWRRCLAWGEKTWGHEDSRLAIELSNLSTTLFQLGRLEEAEAVARRALACQSYPGAPDTPALSLLLDDVATAAEAAGHRQGLAALYRREAAIRMAYGDLLLTSGSSEDRRRERNRTLRWKDQVVSFDGRPGATPEDRIGDAALEAIWALKAADILVSRHGAEGLERSVSPSDLTSLLVPLKQARERLRRDLDAQLRSKATEAQNVAVAAERTEAERLSRRLLPRVPPLMRAPWTSVAEVQRALPRDAALVEFAAYSPFDPRASGSSRWGPQRYVAYVVHGTGRPARIELGPASEVDQQVRRLRQSLADPNIEQFRAQARDAYRMLWQRVAGELKGAKQVFVSPAGALGLVPFEALVDNGSSYLVEQLAFTYLAAGSEAGALPATAALTSGPVIVVPGPSAEDRAEADPLHDLISHPGRSLRPADFGVLKRRVGVVAKRSEADVVRTFLPGATVLARPTSTAFESLRSPLVLHVSLPTSAEHEGSITAETLSGLALHGTRLLVVSAADARPGDPGAGDGFENFRAAIEASGAETQLVTLWAGDEAVNRLLLGDYYRRIMNGEGRSQALRAVKLSVIGAHPALWAHFTIGGTPGPMQIAPH